MVKPLKNVLETAKELGARKFAKLIEQSGVRNQFVREGAITLFAPHDDAMKSIEPSLEQSMVPFSSNLNNLINYHTMDNRLKSSLYEADMMINTKYEGYKLRLNKFSSWDGRFNIFSQAMENTGTSRMLRKSKSPVTVLAPTDEAFKYMKRSTLQRILNDDKAGEALIKNHILPHTLCSAAVIGQHKLKTESKDKVIIECNENGIILDNTTSLDEFLSGENGVIYVTNRVMLPDKAKCLTKLMEDLQLNTFLKLVKFARVDETFDESGDYTVFVPTEDGMSGVQKEKLNELFQDRNKAKQFVLHHTIQGKLKVQEISDHQVARSLDEENSVRFHINRKYLGIDGAIIEKENIEGRNGILHVISKPLVAINKGWDEVLQQNSSYSTFMDAIRKTPLRNDLRANLFKTIFVPTNQAFKNLGQSYVDQLMENVTYLTEVENALVISSDILTRNGVMHIINEVLHKKNR
uniref:FAS1 domain-containing protein n=1 Tax=Rhodnius prolixus TaxID=13249 RepID=T1HCC0_RHOPR